MWIIHRICKLLLKKFTFFLHGIRMRGKNIAFDDKKINKSNFYKYKKLFKIDDIDINKILVFKRDPYHKKAHLNTLLGMMIKMTLDYYV